MSAITTHLLPRRMSAAPRRFARRALQAALAMTAMLALPLRNSAAAPEPASAPVLLPVENDPTLSFRLWFKVGAQDDPKGKEGLAALTAAMVAEAATRRHSYEEVLDRLFPLATEYEAHASMEMTVISGRTHRDNLGEFYPLLLDAVVTPAFKQEDLDRLKSRALNVLETTLRYSSDEELGKAVLYNSIFAGTPYGHIVAGTVEAVKSITLDDIRGFHARHYTRDNVVIGLGGGFGPQAPGGGTPPSPEARPDDGAAPVTPATVLSRLQADLRRLPAGRPPEVPAPQPRPLDGTRVTLVEKKNAGSTAISVGFPIRVLRGQKDWYALAIANSWLGEHRSMGGRLFQVIRDVRGLNYGDYSYLEHFPAGGLRFVPPPNVGRRQQIFEIWIRPVPHAARHFALRAALRELQQLIDRGMTREDFELKRQFLKKYVLHYAPTTMTRLGYALDDVFYGIGGDGHLRRFQRMMDELTLDDVNAAIKRHWQVANLQIAAVTDDAKAFADALVENTPSPITYSSPKPAEVLAEDKLISTYPLKIQRENITIVPVTDVFAK